jgi:hypothetical protein
MKRDISFIALPCLIPTTFCVAPYTSVRPKHARCCLSVFFRLPRLPRSH